MYVKNLQLLNYRNYEELNIELNKGINIFVGDNAQGKTNILESIYYSSIGKSHRTNRDKELINWDKAEAYIKLHVAKERLDKNIEIKIFKDGKKGVRINSIKVNKISELIGVFNSVMFAPEDLKIVKESPGYRRKFLDIELCKLSNKYYYNLVQYNKVLDERNILLKKWGVDISSMIDIYDEQLSRFGSFLIKQRCEYINKLNNIGKKIHNRITLENEEINFKYISSVKNMEDPENELKEIFRRNLKSDMEKRTTGYGAHRDDFSVEINGIDVRNFGSQGQQRTAVLTIKFSSLDIIKEQTNEYPVLLLDDVLSELDLSRQKYILNSLNEVQTIITCTDIESIKQYMKGEVNIFYVKKGIVSCETVCN